MPTATLPNGHIVQCTQRAEALLLWGQVKGYFRHGLTLKAGDTVFDVGANIGLFSLLAGQWGNLPLRGFAFEPVPDLHAALERNLREYPNIQIQPLCCAVGEQVGHLTLHHYPRASMLSTAFPQELTGARTQAAAANALHRLPKGWRWMARLPQPVRLGLIGLGMALLLKPRQIRCPVQTLSALIDQAGVQTIDLLKIDVERAELAVLNGIQARHWPLIQQLVVEVHDQDGRLAHIEQMLGLQGFSVVREQTSEEAAFGLWHVYARR